MWQPTVRGWWILLTTALLIVGAWPPNGDRSLLLKFTNWAVDPYNQLPVLPPQLDIGVGDDPEAVETRDALVRRYDELYARGGWTRKRLEMKVAGDPINAATERQLLLGLGVIVAFVVWRASGTSP